MTAQITCSLLLPENFSDFVELAVEDLKKCIVDPRYEINIGSWHEPSKYGTCIVCLGGAVLAQSFHMPRHVSFFSLESIDQGLMNRLDALDLLANGRIELAILKIDPNAEWHGPNSQEINYEDWDEFCDIIVKFAKLLRDGGY